MTHLVPEHPALGCTVKTRREFYQWNGVGMREDNLLCLRRRKFVVTTAPLLNIFVFQFHILWATLLHQTVVRWSGFSGAISLAGTGV